MSARFAVKLCAAVLLAIGLYSLLADPHWQPGTWPHGERSTRRRVARRDDERPS